MTGLNEKFAQAVYQINAVGKCYSHKAYTMSPCQVENNTVTTKKSDASCKSIMARFTHPAAERNAIGALTSDRNCLDAFRRFDVLSSSLEVLASFHKFVYVLIIKHSITLTLCQRRSAS